MPQSCMIDEAHPYRDVFRCTPCAHSVRVMKRVYSGLFEEQHLGQGWEAAVCSEVVSGLGDVCTAKTKTLKQGLYVMFRKQGRS